MVTLFSPARSASSLAESPLNSRAVLSSSGENSAMSVGPPVFWYPRADRPHSAGGICRLRAVATLPIRQQCSVSCDAMHGLFAACGGPFRTSAGKLGGDRQRQRGTPAKRGPARVRDLPRIDTSHPPREVPPANG